MGGGKSPPSPPDYTPFIQASMNTSQADAHAADLQYQLGQQQLEQQGKYAERSANVADAYFQMAKQQQEWGKQQFDSVWPYAQSYLQSQQSLNTLAGKSAQEQLDVAQQQRQQAKQTYDRYMTAFAPLEEQYAQTAANYNTPARADAASAAAQVDVASAFGAQADAARNTMRSYGIDPSSTRYAGMDAILRSQQAAASAAAGTQARRQQELTGLQLQTSAIEVGQKLPATAIAQTTAGTQASSAGLAYGGVGGTGIGTSSNLITAGTNAQGSPTSYAALANPYTTLAGTYGSIAGSMFSGGNAALGNAGSALGYGITGLNDSFQNQMSQYNAQVQQQQALWGGVGKLVGGAASFALGGPAGGMAYLNTGGLY